MQRCSSANDRASRCAASAHRKLRKPRSNVESARCRSAASRRRPTSARPSQPAQRLAESDTPPPPATPHRHDRGRYYRGMPATGSTQSLRARGVLELGGFANLTGANNFTSIQIEPHRRLLHLRQLRALRHPRVQLRSPDLREPRRRGDDLGSQDHRRVLIEPSYHLPLSSTIWAFLGIGLGVASVPRAAAAPSRGFDFAPRVGANFLVGRSGLFTPAVLHRLHDGRDPAERAAGPCSA